MKVIIVGAGIAGLAAGIGLRRGGHQVTIYERSSLAREIGAALNICPNASRVLLEWKFQVERARLVTARRHILARGDTLETLRDMAYPDFREHSGGPWYLAHRVDLHNELQRLARDPEGQGRPVDIRLRSEVVGYDADKGSITLADGSVQYGDLVIGADGVHSTAIRAVHGHSTHVEPTGWSVFRFLIPTEDLRNDPDIAPTLDKGATTVTDGMLTIFTAPEGQRRLVRYPCADNMIQNFVAMYNDPQIDDHEREDWDRSATIDDILSYYHDFHPDLLNVIRKATDIKRWPLLYRDPLPTISKGRLVLIGDAAHPMLPHQGQGGAMSIEDGGALGEVFAGLLEGTPGDEIHRRIALFEKIRHKRASGIQVMSNAGQDQMWRVRDRMRPFMPEGVEPPNTIPEIWEHNFRYDVLADSRRQLKEYLEGR
ncbi:FAD/NAD(P)-binding domain-containing protein [Aspergillus pseudodeflectus]|uniref:FAD/NAD(P)-binding domain-containing protein n=1 Tax=Aspergillus pseudodeflectus TaxID=176178 RepID=A0ABR4L6S6_9EURO